MDKETSDTNNTGYRTLRAYGHRILQGFEKAMEDPVRLNGPLNVWLPPVVYALVPRLIEPKLNVQVPLVTPTESLVAPVPSVRVTVTLSAALSD